MRYPIKAVLSLPALANPKHASLTIKERSKRGCRVIGGDKGDVEFDGYTLDPENNRTILDNPVLTTDYDVNMTEAEEIAQEIIDFSFNSIGIETVEHN